MAASDAANGKSRVRDQAMKHNAVSIRPFIGAKDFALSREFYKDLGFQESVKIGRAHV